MIKLRVTSKIVLKRLQPDVNTLILDEDELEYILQELQALESDCVLTTADLLDFLLTNAHHPDSRKVLLKSSLSDVLSDMIDTGTEVEQALVAELISAMLSEDASIPITSSPTSKSSQNNLTANNMSHDQDVSEDNIKTPPPICDNEGSIEAVNILLHEVARLMEGYVSDSFSSSADLNLVAAGVSLVWGLTKQSKVETKVGISNKIAQSPKVVTSCCDMLKYYPGKP